MCVLYMIFESKVSLRTVECVAMFSAVVYFEVQIALLFCRVWSEQRASCFVWNWCEIVLFCPGTNFMYVWLYVFLGCTRACMYRCDGDVICIFHYLNRCSGWWYVCSVNVE